jgi:DNA-3-methyladenine glycosylase II
MGEKSVKERIILGPECVEEGVTWLVNADPRFAAFLKNTGPLPLRLKPDGFAAVLNAIIGQQISVASANATWARIVDAGFDQPANLNAATDDELRAVGFSRPKVRYAKALAEADVDFAALRELPTAQVIQRLIALPGIGLWTAEIYAKFSLGRADVLAAGDLAIQEAAKLLFELDTRPTEKELRAMALAWSPWRSVAARALWEYYRQSKQREGIA